MGNSIVQHGPLNKRVYLMNLAIEDCPEIVARLEHLAGSEGYTKIFAKIPESSSTPFKDAGYVTEAYVPGLYRGREDVRFMAFFLEQDRLKPSDPELMDRVVQAAMSRAGKAFKSALPDGYQIIRMKISDAVDMAGLYSRVFDSYPFPVFDPAYLRKIMQENFLFYGIKYNDRLAGLAAAETDMDSLSAEMTDFAVLHSHRGRGLAGILLQRMSQSMRNLGIETLFTIARAFSFEINITFARAGYKFAGTLVNNTHMDGQLESMNVWYRSL